MDNIRQAVRGMPSQLSIPILRQILRLPAPVARIIMNELTEPLGKNQSYIKKVYEGGWTGAWIGEGMAKLESFDQIKERVRSADVVLFNVHGGPFRVGTSTMFMNAYSAWIKILKEKHNINAVIMSVKYRLAPEHKYPAATEDSVKAYKYLARSLGISPHKIVVTGDSAGGAILVETMLEVYAPELLPSSGYGATSDSTTSGKDLPAAMLLVSPVMSAETNSPSWKKNAKFDMIGPKLFKKVFKEYFGTTDPSATDVRLIAMTQMQEGFDRFIPKNVMIVVGSKEVMRDDITEMALRVVKNSNINGQLLSEDYAHDWYVIRDTVKDKNALKRSDRVFADFVANALQQAKIEKEATATGKLIDTGSSINEHETPKSNVQFTRNGVTMKFTKATVLELMSNFEGDNVATDGYGITLDSIADMAGSSQTRLLAA
ncbi:hypothetical protein INT43_000045 [Umbelopsis isabellina]|uniref:Alpha/beta hydrolase fold-3 domain-containing protein n=1 Tax=Mortierella isabellina TaxID=91625 RepID=A0A8H7PEZ8_MORIS|nr:hypothetical protein INT43_000045 [Umbelopsis isabellina]